ncbi:polyketide synthase [Corallococcus sp. AB011P]|nr:type I polyketide synthase [Corallococcus sp. AB011P]RKG52246.1 polyketide synthase [Corallococcus sp. AB011P]
MSDQAEVSEEAIAIVGMSGRFPGAPSVEALWHNVRDGVESFVALDDRDLETAGVDPALSSRPGYVRAAYPLEGVDRFDAAFFGLSPRAAEILDPQHRLFLECAWEALEHAGYDAESWPKAVALFAGTGAPAYLYSQLIPQRELLGTVGTYQVGISNEKDFLPTRVAHKLGLRGPCIAVQTACSSSLVAVHLACQSLLSGESSLALAGGVSLSLPQRAGYLAQEGDILSPDGHCRAFDARAQGTVRGSGAGIVVLKRLTDALAQGDTIHAVIRGSAVNNDGAGRAGYTAPGAEGQAAVISEALGVAGVKPGDIQYIEAHGTATPLGDPIEVSALNQAFRSRANAPGTIALGSLKTNIGHLDTAAGVAGLIKVVMALRHQQLPPSLHFERPNPAIDFAAGPFFVNNTLRPWESRGAPRRAGVSSFGIGGTNAHVILEEAPSIETAPSTRASHLLLLSARSEAALDAATEQLASHLSQHPDLELADVAYTLMLGRRRFEHRRAIVCRDGEDARQVLTSRDESRLLTQHETAVERQTAFLFPGQGAQFAGMARGLHEQLPVFRKHLDACCDLLLPTLKLDLRQLLLARDGDVEADRQLRRTALTQPALFVVSYALARTWMAWGVKPRAMLGHSVGEYVAACLAGVLKLEDALSLIAARGALIEQLPPRGHALRVTPGGGGPGAAGAGPVACGRQRAVAVRGLGADGVRGSPGRAPGAARGRVPAAAHLARLPLVDDGAHPRRLRRAPPRGALVRAHAPVGLQRHRHVDHLRAGAQPGLLGGTPAPSGALRGGRADAARRAVARAAGGGAGQHAGDPGAAGLSAAFGGDRVHASRPGGTHGSGVPAGRRGTAVAVRRAVGRDEAVRP